MFTNLRVRRAGRLCVALVAVGLLATACGSSGDGDAESTSSTAGEVVPMPGVPGVTDSEIRYAVVGTNSNNPLGTCYLDCFVNGVEAYFAYRNSQGGIYGRELTLADAIDDELGKNQEKAVQIVSADDAFGVFNVPIIGSGYSPFNEAGWPVYTYLIDHVGTAGMTNVFASYSNACLNVCPRIDYPYVANATKSTKVAVLGFAAAKGCIDQAKATFDTYADVTDARVVYTNDTLAFGIPNGVAPEVTAMKNAGVDLIFGCLDGNTMKAIAQEAERQSLSASLVFYASSDENYLKENAAILEGSIVGTHLRPFLATPTEGQKLYRTWMKKIGKTADENAVHGWIAADLAYQGLERAGAPLTRKKVIDATNTLKAYTADGWINPRDIGATHEPQTPTDAATHGEKPFCLSYFRIQDGEFEMLAPATTSKPYICWPGTTYDWSDPTARTF
jgi:branched-chain amino acid transport system substrate-binding protein